PAHIIEKQLYHLADKIERAEVDDAEMDKYTPGVIKKLGWLSSEDLIKRVLSLEFKRLLDYYKDAPSIDVIDEKPAKEKRKAENGKALTDKDKDRRTADKGMERIYVNVGKRDGFYAGNLIDMLNHTIAGQRVDVGRIDLLPAYTLFDVKKRDAKKVVGALKNADFMGKRLYSEVAEPDKDYARTSNRRSRDNSDDEPFGVFKRKKGKKSGRK
ncbi:MAG: DbpA RNA binding domain-containing protein, partial [Muribaculaceae bacterium]|nr:DbpA RNA binding domain-containing protein [Muribaculaceae bacterium]